MNSYKVVLGMRMTCRHILALAIIAFALAAVLPSSLSFAAAVPFSDNFDSYNNTGNPNVIPTGFTETQTNTWAVKDDSVGNDYENAITRLNSTPSTLDIFYQFARVTITNLSAQNFTVSAEMSIDQSTSSDSRNNITVGLMALANFSTFNFGYDGSVDILNTGMGTISIGENSSTRASSSFPNPIVGGTAYTLKLTGQYNGPSSLTLTFSLSDGSATATVTYVDSSPTVGQEFGFIDTLLTYPGGTTASLDVDYDNFSIVSNAPTANNSPTNILLSNTNVAENLAGGTTVGSFSTQDPDTGNTFVYALTNGTGSTDNGSFTINGSNLLTAASFNYEIKSNYSIRVQSTDQDGLFTQKVFAITVSNVNETPTNILLSSTNVAENLAFGTTVGSFSTQDPDFTNTFTYTLVAGTGSGDNGSFTISGSNLLTAATFNYEVKSNCSIRVQSADHGGLSTQKVFAVNVVDVDERPVFYEPSDPTNGNIVLRWSSITNKLYTVHHSTNLLAGFSVLQSNIPATPAINSYTQSVLTVPQRFWRITTDP